MVKLLITGMGSGYGGISSVLLNALENFDRSQVSATVVLFEESILEQKIVEMGYDLARVTPFGVNRKLFRKEMELLMKSNSYDYVWVNKSSKVNVDIFKLAKKYGIKTIAHSHGSFLECSSKLRFIATKVIELFTSRSFHKNVDIPLACSNTAGEYLFSKKYRKKHEINVLLNTIDVEKFRFNAVERERVREQWGIDNNKRALIAVGRLVEIKNPFFMLKLIEKLPNNYKLILVGDGELRGKIEEDIERRALVDKVVVLGARGDVDKMLSGADIFILPSYHEGFPVAAIEAQTNGLQCVISESITDEAVVLENCQKADIANLDEWVVKIRALEEVQPIDRQLCADKMTSLGFDNKLYAKKFLEILQNN